MPYISREDREVLQDFTHTPANAGQLNFLVTTLVDDYISARGLSYTVLNEAIGVLECAKLELYRRLAAPYETIKMAQNGDVYKTQVPGFTKPLTPYQRIPPRETPPANQPPPPPAPESEASPPK